MQITISKRKLKSYERAEEVCRELRYQIEHAQRWDANVLCDHLQRWMRTTGNVKYKRPTSPNNPLV